MFGERWGNWAIAPFQWSVLVGLAITYTATAGQSLQAGALFLAHMAYILAPMPQHKFAHLHVYTWITCCAPQHVLMRYRAGETKARKAWQGRGAP